MDVNSKYVIGDKEIGSGHYGVVRTCTSRGIARLAKRGMEALPCEVAKSSTPQTVPNTVIKLNKYMTFKLQRSRADFLATKSAVRRTCAGACLCRLLISTTVFPPRSLLGTLG